MPAQIRLQVLQKYIHQLSITIYTTRWIAEHDAAESQQFDFDSASKTHQHCQQSAAGLHRQH